MKNLQLVNSGKPLEVLSGRAKARDNRLDDDRLKVEYGREGFVTAGKRFLRSVATSDLQPVSLKLLLWLMSNMKEGNCVRMTQIVIAEKLGLKAPHVSRALRELREAGYCVVEKGADGRPYIFVDPSRTFASGGSAQARAKVHYLKAACAAGVVVPVA